MLVKLIQEFIKTGIRFSLDGALIPREVGMPSDEQIDKQIQINKTYFNL